MRDFIFVHPTYQYDSYTDYRDLIRLSGFESCNQDQMDANRKITYVVSPLNGDVQAALNARPKGKRACKVVWWFLERPGPMGGPDFVQNIKNHMNLVDEVWFSDRAMWRLFKGEAPFSFVPTGGDERLCVRENRPLQYDYCHMSYVYGRREKIHNKLKHFRVGSNGWGEQRRDTLLRSGIMVNTHQDDDLYYEPLRFALCAAYALPMISETCLDPFPYEDGVDFLGASFFDVAALAERVIKEGCMRYKPYGERMFEKACKKWRFSNIIKDMAAKG